MNKAQIQHEYRKTRNPAIPSWLFAICLVIGMFMWFGPIMGWYSFGSVGITLLWVFGGFVALLFLSGLLTWISQIQLFQRPEIHTHNNNCVTCGNGKLYGDAFVDVPEAYRCRHDTDQPIRYS